MSGCARDQHVRAIVKSFDEERKFIWEIVQKDDGAAFNDEIVAGLGCWHVKHSLEHFRMTGQDASVNAKGSTVFAADEDEISVLEPGLGPSDVKEDG
jgi:hypothetical protein